jgi:hypothetical protein
MRVLQYQVDSHIGSEWMFKFSIFWDDNTYTEVDPNGLLLTQGVQTRYFSFYEQFTKYYHAKDVFNV